MAQKGKKVLLSGVKPTGRPHIGNYFGAMRQFVDLQNAGSYENFFFAANYHALTTQRDAEKLRRDTHEVVIDYLAIGLDPQKSTIYLQSDVPEVAELAWIFNCLVTVPFLSRAHAYKDALAKNSEPNAGLFTYPVLMAADILLPGADVVPVGKDQRQHVEYARDIAEKFNTAYGETFKLPAALILEDVAVVPGTDGQKMSKSYGNTVPLFATREEITRAVMSIVTDSSGDFPKNVFALHKLFKPESELKKLYDANKRNYKTLKEALIDDMDTFLKPLREKRTEIAKDPDAVSAIVKNGGEQARECAMVKMQEIRQKTGLVQ